MDTGKRKTTNEMADGSSNDKPKKETLYKPQSKLEKWLVAIACATFFPLVYLIGRAVIYLFG